MLSTFIVNPELSVVCFRRDNSRNGPFFAVREFDIKVIRSRDKGRRGRGPSEQAIRASIRQAVLNMNLKSERATKNEIRQLKGHGILGKRAPSCSLLCAEDMIKLLAAFGKDSCVRDLRAALLQDRKTSSPEAEKKTKNGNLLVKRKVPSPSVPEVEVPPLASLGGIKRPKINSPRQKISDVPVKQVQSLSPQASVSQSCAMSDSNGLDALYSALLAFSKNTELPPVPNGSPPSSSSSSSSSSSPPPSPSPSSSSPVFLAETENNSDSSPYSLPSPLSISPSPSPSTSPSRDPWSFNFPPSSPSSPLSDASLHSHSSSDHYMRAEEETFLKRIPTLPMPYSLSYSHPTVLRPRKKKIKSRLTPEARLAAEISSLSSDIIAKLIADQSKHLPIAQTPSISAH